MKTLLIVDVQYDFLPGGALAVSNGDQIIPFINSILDQYELILATQDWHPFDHVSFASNHDNKKPGEMIKLNGLDQILWPVHCVQNSYGAEFADELKSEKINKVFQKGTDISIDSYSGFFDNGKKKSTGLHDFLQSKNVSELDIVGLATDYCVKFTSLDAADLGYRVNVLRDGVRAVNLNPEDEINAFEIMETKGIKIL